MNVQIFDPAKEAGEVLAAWWKSFEQRRGERAELRRCHGPAEAAVVPATVELAVRLRGTAASAHGGWEERVPLVAALAARLDPAAAEEVLRLPKREEERLPARMAARRGDRVLVSEARFRRLLRTPREELLVPMGRVLSLLEGRASLFELAEAIFWWGPRLHRDWAFVYFPRLPRAV